MRTVPTGPTSSTGFPGIGRPPHPPDRQGVVVIDHEPHQSMVNQAMETNGVVESGQSASKS